MNRNALKKLGRRKAGTWGRPRKGNKRVANKAVRRVLLPDVSFSGIAVLDE